MALKFVATDTVRLPLSGGEWIDVKTELPYGEVEKLRTSALRTLKDGGDVGIDMSAYNLGRMEAWIVEWSARDAKGEKVRLTRAAFAALDEESAEEIKEALDKHIEAVEEKKKPKAPTTEASDGTSESPSASGWDGPTPTSAKPRPVSSRASSN